MRREIFWYCLVNSNPKDFLEKPSFLHLHTLDTHLYHTEFVNSETVHYIICITKVNTKVLSYFASFHNS